MDMFPSGFDAMNAQLPMTVAEYTQVLYNR